MATKALPQYAAAVRHKLTDAQIEQIRSLCHGMTKVEIGLLFFDGSDRRCKLTDEQVIEIQALCRGGSMTQREIAAQYGISDVAVYHIKSGQRKPRS